MEGITLHGVREVLDLGDLEFPVLLDEREDEDGVVIDRGTVGGRPDGCHLHDRYVSRLEVT